MTLRAYYRPSDASLHFTTGDSPAVDWSPDRRASHMEFDLQVRARDDADERLTTKIRAIHAS